MVRTLPVMVALLIVSAVGATASASVELVTNGSFDLTTAWDWGLGYPAITNAAPWSGDSHTLLGYGGDIAIRGLYAQSGSNGLGDNVQTAFQFVPLTAGEHYDLSAELKSWTGGIEGDYSTVEIRLYMLNSTSLDDSNSVDGGYGWRYLTAATINHAATTTGDINNWYTLSAGFDLPVGFDVGSQQGVALWGLSNGGIYQSGWAWDNVSLQQSVLAIPEPGTLSLLVLGIVGLGGRIRRRAKVAK